MSALFCVNGSRRDLRPRGSQIRNLPSHVKAPGLISLPRPYQMRDMNPRATNPCRGNSTTHLTHRTWPSASEPRLPLREHGPMLPFPRRGTHTPPPTHTHTHTHTLTRRGQTPGCHYVFSRAGRGGLGAWCPGPAEDGTLDTTDVIAPHTTQVCRIPHLHPTFTSHNLHVRPRNRSEIGAHGERTQTPASPAS